MNQPDYMKKNYLPSNKKLAEVYFEIAAQRSRDHWYYHYQKKRIREAEIKLSSCYYKNKSFDGIKTLGVRTRKILELILEDGVEKAKEIVGRERTRSMKKQKQDICRKEFPTSNRPSFPLFGEESCDTCLLKIGVPERDLLFLEENSWDDAVRIWEGD
jgi:hypothetical protein